MATSALAKRVEEIAQAQRLKRPVQPAAPVRLPIWPDDVRAIPNSMLRSALFGVARGPRAYLEGVQIPAQAGIEISYTGPRLDQGDLDALITVMHVARAQALGDQCFVSTADLLRRLGLTDGSANAKTLKERLTRLRSGTVEIRADGITYVGGLISRAARHDATGIWVIVLDSSVRALFESSMYTHVQWSVRQALHKRPLAQWLHGFYASHAAPFPIAIETLSALAGSSNSDPYSAAQKIKKALHEVVQASAAHGEPFAHEIKNGLVYVSKTPSRSQRKHLSRKGPA